MVRTRVQVNVSRALKKLAKVETKLKQEGNLTVKELAELGKNYARVTAPAFTGDLIRNIKVFKGGGPDTRTIVSQNPRTHLYPRNKYPDFSLPRWLNETGGVFQSDNPFGKKGTRHVPRHRAKYMEATSRYLRQVAPGKAKKIKNKIKII
jgi:hypothetical protein